MDNDKIVFLGDYSPVAGSISSLKDGCYTVVNLECSFSDKDINTISSKAYSSIVPRHFIEQLDSSDNIFYCLANNHTLDGGITNFITMIKYFDSKSIKYYGTIDKPYLEIRICNLNVAIIGCLESCRSRGNSLFPEENVENLIKCIDKNYDQIIITPHWGAHGEYAHYPSPSQVNLASKWVKAGASMIIGHHPHVIQGGITIDDKPVFFSIGNAMLSIEQGYIYPMTRWGIGISYSPSKRYVDMRFVDTENGKWINNNTALSDNLTNIYNYLSTEIKKITWIHWARLIGKHYITKSTESFKIRFKKSIVRTLPVFIIWSLLPITLLLRIGSWFNYDDTDLKNMLRKFIGTIH